MKRTCVLVVAMVVLALSAASTAQAGTISPFVGNPQGTARTDNFSFAGFNFTAATPGAQVNQLGYWDEGGDGLLTVHNVGLFQVQDVVAGVGVGTQIAGAEIPANTAATLEGGYRWVTVPTVTLTAGAYYTVLACNGLGTGGAGGLGDTWYTVTGLFSSVDASFGALDGWGAFNAAPSYDALPLPGNGNTIGILLQEGAGNATVYGGGNIGYVPEGYVPEPATMSLLALGGLALLRRKRL